MSFSILYNWLIMIYKTLFKSEEQIQLTEKAKTNVNPKTFPFQPLNTKNLDADLVFFHLK